MNIASKEESPRVEARPLEGFSNDTGGTQSRLPWLWVALPLGFLWFHLINNLRIEWSTNPQYSYGLVVPFLVVGLLVRRWQIFPANHAASKSIAEPAPSRAGLFSPVALVLLALYLPTRLIEDATPEWRPLQWVLAMEVVGITLYTVYLAGGKGWFQRVSFPIAFILVAVPWPSPIEQGIIQGLSRMNASMVVEILGLFSLPAIQHGNVIEVSTGMVGINDACSGIRSLQSSLMISLFMGEFYWFNWRRRLLLVPISAALAMVMNVCRTTLLTWVAAKDGTDAIARYHDEAGMTILLACTTLLWITAWLMKRWSAPAKADSAGTISIAPHVGGAGKAACGSQIKQLGIALIIWLVIVEVGVELWYRVRESNLKPGPNWTVQLPERKPTFEALPFTAAEHQLLRFDEGQQGKWQETDGSEWQVFYFNWLPGRVAGYLAKRHTPDICMTAVGYNMLSGPELRMMNVHGVVLPMRHYVFSSASGPLQVYQCHWEAGIDAQSYTANESSRFNLIRGVWAGRGNHGQKVLEVIISGFDDSQLAEAELTKQLQELITLEK